MQAKSDNEKKTDPKAEKPDAIKRGEAAIKAAEKTNPKPANKAREDEKKDAEQWRNEG